jgi:hypothetical protein
MNYIVSSATTYQGKHPSLNIIYLDPETMLPVDYETHYMDLDEANKLGDDEKPVWKQKYNYRDYFHLEDLSPKSFLDHANYQIFYNETAAIEYRRHRSIDGPAGAGEYPCDAGCKRLFFCQTTCNGYDEWNMCMGNPQKNWEYGRDKDEGIFETFENVVAHNWYSPKQ